MRTTCLAIAALGLALFASARTSAQADAGRPVDRSVVRVLTVHGADTTVRRARSSGAQRLFVSFEIGHGTGFAIAREGLVVTARHVVAGADMLAVIPPGAEEARPARVLYADPDHDVAVLEVDATFDSALRLPTGDGRIAQGALVSGSGFPYDVTERTPAAIAGTVGRVNEDGRIHAYLPVNPGNSGGPVVDARGDLVGVVSMGANTRSGAQGFALLEPASAVRRALPRAQAARVAVPFEFRDSHVREAALLAHVQFVSREEEIAFDAREAELVERGLSGLPTHEAGIVLALFAWNLHLELLESYRVDEIAQLPDEVQPMATRLRDVAHEAIRRVLGTAPYVAVTYPAAMSVVSQGTTSVVVQSSRRQLF